jgi:hypothetical protein
MGLLHRNCAQWKREEISRFHGCDLIRLTVQLSQSFAFHLQFHLRILLEDLRVALTKHLSHPLIGYSSGTQPGCIGGPEIVEPKVGNLRPAKCSSPDRFESCLKTARIRAAVLLGILQTPQRFRTKRQLWAYSGFGIETQSSADHRRVDGQLKRVKKQSSLRGLNRNCNHDLKNLFKGAAVVASSKPGPLQEFYTTLLSKGIRPEMARLTLARKIATIVLIVWKRGVCFEAQHLKPQTA